MYFTVGRHGATLQPPPGNFHCFPSAPYKELMHGLRRAGCPMSAGFIVFLGRRNSSFFMVTSFSGSLKKESPFVIISGWQFMKIIFWAINQQDEFIEQIYIYIYVCSLEMVSQYIHTSYWVEFGKIEVTEINNVCTSGFRYGAVFPVILFFPKITVQMKKQHVWQTSFVPFVTFTLSS